MYLYGSDKGVPILYDLATRKSRYVGKGDLAVYGEKILNYNFIYDIANPVNNLVLSDVELGIIGNELYIGDRAYVLSLHSRNIRGYFLRNKKFTSFLLIR